MFELLLEASQFEFVLKNMFRGMLADKQARWDALKAEGPVPACQLFQTPFNPSVAPIHRAAPTTTAS